MAGPRKPNISGERASAMYEMMLTIRRSEVRLNQMFADGEIPGFIHSSVGQEAISAGVIAALGVDDSVASTHRGHGHAIAKGIDLSRFFQEIMAKEEGCCRGRGGSMHVADASLNMLGANGIVGASMQIALGSAIAHQQRESGAVAVVFFGDGALATGIFHECMNLASLWKLPLVFICENNGWSEFSPTSIEFCGNLMELSRAFKVPATIADGNDVFAVFNTAEAVIAAARAHGPQLLELKTTRIRGHFEGDQQKYRSAEEFDAASKIDPIMRAESTMQQMGISQADILAIGNSVLTRVEVAVTAARAGTSPSFERAFADVYTQVQQ